MITPSDVERWLREDVGHHDVTNQVPGDTEGRLVAKEAGTVAGLDAARAVFSYLDCEVRGTSKRGGETAEHAEAGDRIEPGDVVLEVTGSAREILRGERVAVNVVGHASGIATKTHDAVQATGDHDTRIAGTRKTTPGLRGVEKRAVAAGGGDTHRLDLSHMVMVKDNHVAAMGLDGAISHFRERASFATKLDVEVEAVEDAPRAAEYGADIVLLDNMTPAETERAAELVAETDGETLTEASGGITVETVPDYAATGVDIISMGALTHSAPTLDLSFRTG